MASVLKEEIQKMVVPVAQWYSNFLANGGLLSNEKFGLSSILYLKMIEKEIEHILDDGQPLGNHLTLRMAVVMMLIHNNHHIIILPPASSVKLKHLSLPIRIQGYFRSLFCSFFSNPSFQEKKKKAWMAYSSVMH